MDHNTQLTVFRSQTKNVRALRTALMQVHRSINASLRENNKPAVQAFTRIYGLLFCAWAEANFSKIMNTPHGFDLQEIDQIQNVKQRKGIGEAWKKCVELGLGHLDAQRGSFRPNAKQELDAAVDAHVFDPSLLRNKLAHGQWVIALNHDNNAIQQDLTTKISGLDIVKINGWITAHKLLAGLVEHLIESPKKAFMRNWYQFVVDLEEAMKEAESRTLQEHVTRLLAKDAATGAKAQRRGPKADI